MSEFGFGPPAKDEKLVFGAQRPGYPGKFVQKQVADDWITFIKAQGVSRLVCLLPDEELKYYPTLSDGLLGLYAGAFGKDNVLWAPTPDRQLLTGEAVRHILYFLYDATLKGEKSVVHCSAGLGRTGLVLAAWLVYHHNLTERKAIRTVEEQNRSPREAVLYGNATEAELMKVLAVARELDKPS
ncbi:MAG: dual specificity protein phosphatase family protein [Chloroflexi bacterium]|nr:dual specificity protein phosphatase family protein [Chloroflexota bacterium]